MANNYSIGQKLKKNLLSGLLSQFIIIIMGIIVPRLVLVSYGSEINGFLNSIAQIYACMELLEAGVGGATTQALFKYVGQKDKKKINEVLSATAIFYNRIGLAYALIVLVISILYPLLVSSTIGFWTMFLIIIMQGVPGIAGYLFQSKFRILLSASGHTYVQNNITLATKVLSNLAKIVLITLGYNVLMVQFVFFLINMGQVVVYKMYEKQKYAWIDYHAIPNFKEIEQRNNVFIHQISGLVFRNTDVLILTFFCDLKIVSVYSMYTLVITMIENVLNTFSSGIYFYLGQTFNQDKNKYIKIHDIYETYYMAFVFSLYTITYLLLLPFMKIYTRGAIDINYIDIYLPFLFILIKFLEIGRSSSMNVLNFAQMFKETRHQALIETILNIVFSIIGVYYLGIYGVLVGTIIALLYRGNVMIYYANKKVLKRKLWITYRRWMLNFGIFVIWAIVSLFIPLNISGYISFVLYAIPMSLVVFMVYFSIVSIIEKNVYKNLRQMELLKSLFFKRA